MGYSTEFEGQFECRRLGVEGIGMFLRALHAGDIAALAPLADWLLEHADRRGERVAEFVRAGEVAAIWRMFCLLPEHAAYLHALSETRRMRRDPEKSRLLPDPCREAVGLPIGLEAAYFVGGTGFGGQDHDPSVADYNDPPTGQPGLWCGWVPSEDRTAILWNGAEKFYYYVDWLEYIIAHFLQPWGYVLNGEVRWEASGNPPLIDRGVLRVRDNQVQAVPSEPGDMFEWVRRRQKS